MNDKELISALQNNNTGLDSNYELMQDAAERLTELSDEKEEVERLLKLCIKDLYSPSGKFKKKTGIELYKYVNSWGIEV